MLTNLSVPMKQLVTGLAILCCSAVQAQFQSGFQLAFAPPGGPGDFVYRDGAVDTDGTVALMMGSPDNTASQFLLALVDSTGALRWTKLLNSAGAGEWMDPTKTTFASNGDLLCFGQHFSPSGSRYFQARITRAGEVVHATTYDADADENGGDYGFSDMQALPDGGSVMLFGMHNKSIAARTDADGTLLWARSFLTDDGPTTKNPGFSVDIRTDGSIVLSEKAENDIFLVCIDAAGVPNWSKRYPNGLYNHAKVVFNLSDGGLFVAGSADATPFAMRTDAYGGVIWFKRYDLDEVWIEGFERGVELESGEILLTPTENALGVVGVRISPMGEPVEAILWNDASGYSDLLGTHAGQVITSGTCYSMELNSAATITLLRLEPDLGISCGSGTSGFTATDHTAQVSSMSGCTVADEPVRTASFTLNTAPMISTTADLCAAVTSIEDRTDGTVIRAYPSVLPAGETVHLTWSDGRTVSRVDHIGSDGRIEALRVNERRAAGLDLPTTNWTSGVHTLRCWYVGQERSTDIRLVVH